METLEAILAEGKIEKEPGKVGDLRYLDVYYGGDSQWVPIVDVYQEKIVTIRCHLDNRDYDLKFCIRRLTSGNEYGDVDASTVLGNDNRVHLFYSKKTCNDFNEKFHWIESFAAFFGGWPEDRTSLEQLRLIGLITGIKLRKENFSEESPLSSTYQTIQTLVNREAIHIPTPLWAATGGPPSEKKET